MKQKSKPIIGISSTVEQHNNIPSVHVHDKFIQAVMKGGAIPVVIPIGPVELVEIWISMCDGLLLSSGEDIDPSSFNANPSPQIQKTNLKRDKLEMALIQEALKQKKPILAICRGITMLNAAIGGTVIQDIPSTIQNAINHYQQAERPEPTHDVHLERTSRLAQIFNQEKFRVNSMHHQAIDVLSPMLKVVAIAPDGVIEAVEGTDPTHLIWGIQWHPEEMAEEDTTMLRLFKEFTIECLKKGSV
ncbi:gamma-glutamyl-gamma-aminobutyrate hydrolase family protein [Anaerobacillus alkaliphilus]|uniref:Gamma-glutamyl-gamma-aminobutyrate hydrolase family protein n=1 Tax=Anaerobacillus alkaliphilus TaxID=1548597 RepID=A0A4Q0VMP0_9BACI|nr:gamma-glutamyl-gamma-aminobutyrate hydrolase family protein [Anaerobacillus alkaliphilus]RXI96393.1 gamma-glutamyl-gamma-aminobutyrate hydrolase family protein [Anaerobacillus alkaliphilus]